MSNNLRKKYGNRAVDVKKLKAAKDKEDQEIGYSGDRNFLQLEDGKTCKFRFFPPHNEAAESFLKIRKQYWVRFEDDGEVVNRTVLDGILHGGAKKDLIQEYINFVKKNSKDKEILANIEDWKKGFRANMEWVGYAVKISKDKREFGLLENKKTVRDVLNKEIFVEDDDEEIELDPFTDIEEGLPVSIKYNSKPNKKKGEEYYEVVVGKKAIPMEDEDLEKFDKAKSLDEIFDGAYKVRDFELALKAIEYYDEQNGIDLADDDRWLEIVEEVKNQFDFGDDEDEDEKPKKKAKKSAKKPVKEEEEEEDEDDEEEDDDEEEEEEEEEKPAPKKNKKPEPKKEKKGKKVVVEEEEDEDDEEEDDDDEEEEEKPAEKKPKKTLDDIKNKLKGKK